jgi:hypothetical protein
VPELRRNIRQGRSMRRSDGGPSVQSTVQLGATRVSHLQTGRCIVDDAASGRGSLVVIDSPYCTKLVVI